MRIKLLFFLPVFAVCFINAAVAGGDPEEPGQNEQPEQIVIPQGIAATTYVSTAIETRISAEEVLSSQNSVSSSAAGTTITAVDIGGEGLDKKIQLTRSYIKIPNGDPSGNTAPSTSSFIWIED